MRVLGVDPGLTRCGLGVVEGGVGGALRAVAVDVIRTAVRRRPRQSAWSRSRPRSSAWLDTYRPDAVAVERVFSQHNVRTVMGTAQVSGVAIAAAARRGLPVALHTPSEVKAAVTGSGRADKAQVTDDGDAAAAADRATHAGRRRRRARARDLPHLARRGRCPAAAPQPRSRLRRRRARRTPAAGRRAR